VDRFFHQVGFRLRHSVWGALQSRRRLAYFRLLGLKAGPRVSLGRCQMVWPHNVELGGDCIIEDDVLFKSDGPWRPMMTIQIGASCFVGRGSEFNIRKGIHVGAHCAIASGCKFIDHDHGMTGETLDETPGREEGIILHRHVWLGTNVIVLRGVAIGDGAVVGAGSVVTRSIPRGEIWAGVPARRIGQRPTRTVAAGGEPFQAVARAG
jgi:serine acetyltransferase